MAVACFFSISRRGAPMMMRGLGLFVAGVLLSTSSAVAALVGDGVRMVALSGKSAAGTTALFGSFGATALNNAGQVAFRGELSVSTSTGADDTGMWVEKTPGQLTLIARENATAPGTPPGTFADFINDSPLINVRGEVAFKNSPGASIYSQGGNGVLKLIARSNDMAPGTTSRFSGVGDPVLNDSGAMAFAGALPTDPPGIGVSIPGMWRTGTSGAVQLVGLKGQSAPGISSSFSSFDTPVLSGSGLVAFKAGYSFGNFGIWRGGPDGPLSLVTSYGALLPGTSVRLASLVGSPSINNAGKIAFNGTISGSGINTSNDGAVASELVNGQMQLVARENELAPGTSSRFREFVAPLINDRGDTLFRGVAAPDGVTNGSQGLWLNNSAGLQLVATVGQIAPGTDQPWRGIGGFAINNHGEIAFEGDFGTNSSTHGIWAQNRAGQIVEIAHIGQRLDVSNDAARPDFRTINYLTWAYGSSNGDGRGSGFNDKGQVVFFAAFDDNSRGIFISDVATVPEPETLSLVCAVAGIVAAARCPRRACPGLAMKYYAARFGATHRS